MSANAASATSGCPSSNGNNRPSQPEPGREHQGKRDEKDQALLQPGPATGGQRQAPPTQRRTPGRDSRSVGASAPIMVQRSVATGCVTLATYPLRARVRTPGWVTLTMHATVHAVAARVRRHVAERVLAREFVRNHRRRRRPAQPPRQERTPWRPFPAPVPAWRNPPRRRWSSSRAPAAAASRCAA